jgi:hypothetical protein
MTEAIQSLANTLNFQELKNRGLAQDWLEQLEEQLSTKYIFSKTNLNDNVGRFQAEREAETDDDDDDEIGINLSSKEEQTNFH